VDQPFAARSPDVPVAGFAAVAEVDRDLLE
jgi:hypothetical protein